MMDKIRINPFFSKNNSISPFKIFWQNNSFLKFSENERFAKPLDILIQNDQPVESFKRIIDLLQKIDYSHIDGFNDFHYNFKNGLPNFLQNFWKLDDRNINKYLERLT